jgi:uncharacterized protein (TIGR02147 family)
MEPNRSNFRDYLHHELVRRLKENPSFSMRAFAKKLSVDASLLSKILRRKRPVSESFIESAGLALEMSPQQIQWYKQAESMVGGLNSSLTFKLLDQDSFEIIADWLHFAIMELMHVKGFVTDTKWIASRLGVTKTEVESALDRLKRVEVLTIDPNGHWFDNSKGHRSFNLGPEYSSAAHRKAQKQVLNKSLMAIDELSISERDHSSIMMASSPEKMRQAKSMIDRFRQELCAFLEDTNDKKEVYQLAVSIFPITQIKR